MVRMKSLDIAMKMLVRILRGSAEACIDLGSPTIEPCIQMIFKTADKAKAV